MKAQTIDRMDDLKSDPREIALQVEPLCDEAYTAAKLAFSERWGTSDRDEYMTEGVKQGMGSTILLIEKNRRAKAKTDSDSLPKQ